MKDIINNKELRSKFKLIGTHSDCFHCDEVLATTLMLRTKEFENSIIVRTRDQTVLDHCDAQCDVGAIYDFEKRRFDHHQKEFTNHFWEEKDKAREEEAKKKLEEEQKEKEGQEVEKTENQEGD